MEDRLQKQWYVARIILRSKVGEHSSTPWLCDLQVRLIKAKDDDDAYRKATIFGKDAEHSYKNSEGDTVYWEFVGIEELDYVVDSRIADGTEITSILFQHDCPENLVRERESLTIAWIQRNRERRAQDILDDPS